MLNWLKHKLNKGFAVFDVGDPKSRVFGLLFEATKQDYGKRKKKIIYIYFWNKIIEMGYIQSYGWYGKKKNADNS